MSCVSVTSYAKRDYFVRCQERRVSSLSPGSFELLILLAL
jgi:hypothetical protein